MTLIWHIFKKDLRLLRWVLSVWLVLSIFDAINRIVSPRLMAQDDRWMMVLPMWIFIIGIAFALQLVLLVANHIQAERLVGTTAFWLTRPIPRGTLLRSKLLGVTLFVVLPTVIIEAILMAAFHVPLKTIVFACVEQAWVLALMLLALVFAATLTATATRLLFLLIGALVGLYVVFLAILSAAMARPGSFETTGPQIDASDPSAFIVGCTIFGLAALVAIWHHYKRRQPFIAVSLLAAGIVGALATGWLWPNVSLFGGLPTLDHEAWARDPSITRLRVASNERAFVESRAFSAGQINGRMMTYMAAPVVLDGTPPHVTAEPFTMEAQVRFDDGRVVRSEKASAQPHAVAMNPSLAGSPGPETYVRRESWPTLMLAPVDAYKQYGDRHGRYSGTFVYVVHRHDELAVMPLVQGAAYQDGPRSLLVSNLRFEVDSCLVTFRMTGVSLLGDALSRPTLVPRFRQRDGVELKDQRGVGGLMARGTVGMGNMSFFAPHLLQLFDLDYRVSKPVFPTLDESHATSPPCDQMDLIIERRSYAGTLTRTLELTDFRMNDGRPKAPANAQDLVGLR